MEDIDGDVNLLHSVIIHRGQPHLVDIDSVARSNGDAKLRSTLMRRVDLTS